MLSNYYHTLISAQVLCEGELTHGFQVKTGVKQECVLSLFLFLLGIDWIMKTRVRIPHCTKKFSIDRIFCRAIPRAENTTF